MDVDLSDQALLERLADPLPLHEAYLSRWTRQAVDPLLQFRQAKPDAPGGDPDERDLAFAHPVIQSANRKPSECGDFIDV